MMRSCHWVRDKDVPGGRFLVPGCWNRAVHGDHAECQCPRPTKQERAVMLEDVVARLDKLERLILERKV